MTKRRIAKEPRKFWTADEDAILVARFPHEPTQAVAAALGRSYGGTHQRAGKFGLRKSAAYLASPEACRLRKGDGRGLPTRFKPGQVPPNKGLRRPGWGPGRMKETQFKTGQLSGEARRKLKPVGAERMSKEGYLQRKIHNGAPGGVSVVEANRLRQRRWRAVHILVWEEANGPLPRGHAVAFKNGDKRDIRIENLECVTRAEMMKRNTLHNYPKPIAKAIQLIGALNRQIRKRERHASEKQDRRSA